MTAPALTRIPLGGRAIPEPGKHLLQERTRNGKVVREFEHDAAHCAIAEMTLINSFQPGRYSGERLLVVVDPSGTVIAHTGDVRDLLPEWDAAEPSLLQVASAWIGGQR